MVFSSGDRTARIVLVGEQPGDESRGRCSTSRKDPWWSPRTRRRWCGLRGKEGYDEAYAGLVDDLRLAAPYA